jgi:hypothetical protein
MFSDMVVTAGFALKLYVTALDSWINKGVQNPAEINLSVK